MDIDSKIDHALPFLYVAFSLWKDGKGQHCGIITDFPD